jgi:hypothetical protein
MVQASVDDITIVASSARFLEVFARPQVRFAVYRDVLTYASLRGTVGHLFVAR